MEMYSPRRESGVILTQQSETSNNLVQKKPRPTQRQQQKGRQPYSSVPGLTIIRSDPFNLTAISDCQVAPNKWQDRVQGKQKIP
jgi:hypothetical protein